MRIISILSAFLYVIFTFCLNVAQNNGNLSTKFQEEELIYQPDSYYWMFIVNTNGIRRTIRWSVGEHENRGEHIENVAIKWYVNY